MRFLSLLDWIYPPKCVFCNNIIPLNKYNNFNVCDECNKILPFMKSPYCIKCGKTVNEDSDICSECSKKEHFFKKGWIALEYEGMTKEAIYKFKYQNCPRYCKTFAEIMYRAMYDKSILEYSFDLITSVPIHKNKLKKRGYNQAQLIAKELSLKLNLPYEDIIIRIKDTKPQNTLSPKGRSNNVYNAFKVNKEISNKVILIVDDIYTTGSTIDSCVNSIIDIGTNNIVYYYILSAPIKHFNNKF